MADNKGLSGNAEVTPGDLLRAEVSRLMGEHVKDGRLNVMQFLPALRNAADLMARSPDKLRHYAPDINLERNPLALQQRFIEAANELLLPISQEKWNSGRGRLEDVLRKLPEAMTERILDLPKTETSKLLRQEITGYGLKCKWPDHITESEKSITNAAFCEIEAPYTPPPEKGKPIHPRTRR